MIKICLRSCAAALLLFLLVSLFGCATPDAALRVEVLDVGQSDCSLIVQGESVLMIDTGSATERAAVQAALRRLGIEQIDYLVLTHPHEDHIGNARMLIETYTVGALIVPPIEAEELVYELVLQAAERCSVPVHRVGAGDDFSLGSAAVEILQAGSLAEDPNNSSLVLHIRYGSTAFLFTGDNEIDGEGRLLHAVPSEQLDCDWLKAGHHGSENATSAELLAAVTPKYVAVSCGAENSYGFPHAKLLARVQEAGAQCHRTDTEGDLRYFSDGYDVWFDDERG